MAPQVRAISNRRTGTMRGATRYAPFDSRDLRDKVTKRALCHLSLFFLACLKPAFGIAPAVSTLQYLHTSWTQEEGTSLPAVQALAQTSDGYLWLGTAKGLIQIGRAHV